MPKENKEKRFSHIYDSLFSYIKSTTTQIDWQNIMTHESQH